MNVVLESEGPTTAPDTLRAIDGLTAYLDSLPEVGKALSIADPLRQLHSGFADGSGEALPTSQALINQYLLLLESVEYLDDLLSFDRKTANVLLRVDHNGSELLLDVAKKAEDWWNENGREGVDARSTGIMFEFARAEDEIAAGQIRGLCFAVATILMLMLLIFRSPRIVSLAMLPNVLPLILVFGFLGLAAIPMDAGIVVSGCLILGIAVDDTLHLVSSFQRHRLAGNRSREALGGALAEVLTPVVLTTIVLGIGFSVLSLAGFVFVRNLGVLVVAVMVICLLADLLLLPALIVRFEERTLSTARVGGQEGIVK
jgi:predicted RND superfamily exporter protein